MSLSFLRKPFRFNFFAASRAARLVGFSFGDVGCGFGTGFGPGLGVGVGFGLGVGFGSVVVARSLCAFLLAACAAVCVVFLPPPENIPLTRRYTPRKKPDVACARACS